MKKQIFVADREPSTAFITLLSSCFVGVFYLASNQRLL